MKDPKHSENFYVTLNVVDTDNTIQKFEEIFRSRTNGWREFKCQRAR